MYIGIIYDAYANDGWYKIEKDIETVKNALKSVKLPLPVAAIYDTKKDDFIEFNENYRAHRMELLEKAKRIKLIISQKVMENQFAG